MKSILIIAGIFSGLIPSLRGYSADSTLFEYSVEVKSAARIGEPARIPLAQSVLSKSRGGEDYSDLRLMDDQGTEIPYVIYNRIQAGEMSQQFDFIIRSYDQKAKVSVIQLERPEAAPPFRQLDFSTASQDFKKKVTIESSHDSKKWSLVANDVIFDFSSSIALSKTVIELPDSDVDRLKITLVDEAKTTVGDRQLSLSIDGLELKAEGINTKSFRIDAIVGRTGPYKEEEPVLDKLNIPASQLAMTTDKEGNSVFSQGLINLPVSEIVMDVANPYFYRRVELWGSATGNEKDYSLVANGSVYRVTGMKEALASLSPLSGSTLKYAKLVVINQNNPPLRLNGIELKWVRRDLYFIPEKSEGYRLLVGSNEVEPPQYELRDILPQDQRQLAGYQELALTEVAGNPVYRPGKGPKEVRQKKEKSVFTGVMILLVLLIAAWLYRLVKQISRKPA